MTTIGPSIGRAFASFMLSMIVAAVAVAAPPAVAAEKIGIVLMHGVNDTADAKSPMGKFAKELQSFGFVVVAPEMPWSKARGLDKSVDDAMAEIDKAVAEAKAKGATRIAVGGHDIGANAALVYGTRHHEIEGVFVLKPEVMPERAEFRKAINDDGKRAKDMVAAGKGDEKAAFMDGVNGKNGVLKTTPRIYVSWYDPEGQTLLPNTAAKLGPNTSLLWMIGDTSAIGALGLTYAFAKAPANPRNAYKVIAGFHKVLGSKGASEIAAWAKGL
jgi:dienelactone hydrolase